MNSVPAPYNPIAAVVWPEHGYEPGGDVPLFARPIHSGPPLHSQETWESVRGRLIRTAAFETGAVEDLYESKRGATQTIAEEARGWREALRDAGEHAPDRFSDQLAAYERAIEIAQERRGQILEADIRELHSLATQSQETYETTDQFGHRYMRQLRHGEYKSEQNFTADRLGHAKYFAPVIDTGPEIRDALAAYHVKLQAMAGPIHLSSYIHWAIAHIHPFADGNGRTARVLASIPLLVGTGDPYILFADRKETYYQDLDRADGGDPQAFIEHTRRRVAAAGQLSGVLLAGVVGDTNALVEKTAELIASQTAMNEQPDALGQRVSEYFRESIHAAVEGLTVSPGVVLEHDEETFTFSRTYNGYSGVQIATGRVSAQTDGLTSVSVSLRWRVVAASEVSDDWVVAIEDDQVEVQRYNHTAALRYEDCVPHLSNEAALVLDELAKTYVHSVVDVLHSKVVANISASGSLPPARPHNEIG